MSISRISAAVIATVCALFLVFVLPGQVDPFGFGLIRSIHLPFAALVLMTISAVVMFFESDLELKIESEFMIKMIAVTGFSIIALGSLLFVNFEFSMPFFALVVMLLVGERRWYWLLSGFAVPVLVWVLVEIVLGRPLP